MRRLIEKILIYVCETADGIYEIFIGNIETKSLDTGVISRNVAIRNELDLFVNVIHCKSYAGVLGRQKDVDIVIVRQNTEGEYAMLEHEVLLVDADVLIITVIDSLEMMYFSEHPWCCGVHESNHCSKFRTRRAVCIRVRP